MGDVIKRVTKQLHQRFQVGNTMARHWCTVLQSVVCGVARVATK